MVWYIMSTHHKNFLTGKWAKAASWVYKLPVIFKYQWNMKNIDHIITLPAGQGRVAIVLDRDAIKGNY